MQEALYTLTYYLIPIPLNYFAHYFFDHEPENHYYNAGLLMPDFARVADGAKRINTRLEFSADVQPRLYQLNRGSQQHYQTDARFHNSEFFKQHTTRLDELFTKHKFSRHNQRLWFVSHILFEVLLDRVLVQQHPQKLAEFYSSLQKVDIETVIDFLAHSGKEGRGRFSNFWNGFIESQFIQHYTNDESFLYSMNRILQRASQPEMDNAQGEAMLGIVHEMETELPASVSLLAAELRA